MVLEQGFKLMTQNGSFGNDTLDTSSQTKPTSSLSIKRVPCLPLNMSIL